MTDLGDSASRLRTRLGGNLFCPGEPEYEVARSVWNADIQRFPAFVATCSSAEEVAAAIAFGRAEGLEISVRGGGHNFAGHAVAENGLMIDLSGLKGVRVDPEKRRARAGGGCALGELDAAMAEHGLAVTAGVVSHTGIGGLTLGGGVGHLLRKFGLTSDNLIVATVVLADGRIVRASEDDDADLLWALRGGGGNFGVVTEFEYQLHRIGRLAYVATMFYPLDRAAEAARVYRSLKEELPSDMALHFFGMAAADMEIVPAEHRGTQGFMIALVSVNSEREIEAAAAVVCAGLEPAFKQVMPVPYVELQSMFDVFNPWGVHAYEKGLFLADMSDEIIAVIERRMPQRSAELSYLTVFAYGGAYAEKGEMDTAWGGRRDAGYQLAIGALARTAEELVPDRQWVRDFWQDLQPFAIGSGSYINNMNEYQEDRVRDSYGPEKYRKLQELKARYDPENVLHHNQNITPLGDQSVRA